MPADKPVWLFEKPDTPPSAELSRIKPTSWLFLALAYAAELYKNVCLDSAYLPRSTHIMGSASVPAAAFFTFW